MSPDFPLTFEVELDEDNEDEIEPLPNLEQKIICGDSLLESFKGIELFDESFIDTVKNDKIDTNLINNKSFTSVVLKTTNNYTLVTNLDKTNYDDNAVKNIYRAIKFNF